MATITHSKVLSIPNDAVASGAGEVIPSDWNAAHVDANGNPITIRTTLSANTTYYVRTTGSNSNSGLSPATAFATLQYAWDSLSGSLDLGQFLLKIDVGSGTFTLVTGNTWTGGSGVHIVGAGSASTNFQDLTFNSGSSGAGGGVIGPQINIDSATLTSNPSFAGGNFAVLEDEMLGTIVVGYLVGDVKVVADGGGANTAYFHIFGPGVVLGLNILTYAGNPNQYGWWADTQCTIFQNVNNQATLVGSPTVGVAFAEANLNGSILVINTQTNGAFTGAVGAGNFAHFYVFMDGDIDIYMWDAVFGGQINDHFGTFFPGNPGGSVPIGYLEAGGQYHGVTDLFPRTITSYIGGSHNVVGPVAPIQGARGFVTDCSTSNFATVITTALAGGLNFVPMFADGSNWRIG